MLAIPELPKNGTLWNISDSVARICGSPSYPFVPGKKPGSKL
jgi:hypothetical protein